MTTRTGVSRLIEHNGKTQSVSAWARDLGISRKLICTRLNNLRWPVDRALSTVTHVAPSGKPYGKGYVRNGYLVKSESGVQMAEHLAIAARAFGKPLPAGAVVHHADGNPLNNDPPNLVICPNQAYHMMLHRRIRAQQACGNADWRKCKYCKGYAPPDRMKITAHGAFHRECFNEYARTTYAKKGKQ